MKAIIIYIESISYWLNFRPAHLQTKLMYKAWLRSYLGVDLHGEEEPEVGVRSEGVQLLLQRDEPLRGQVHVLQQHPAAGLGGRVDGLVRLAEAFR